MIYNFDNIAIKCDTWEQMMQLKEIAERQGLTVLFMSEKHFDRMPIFRWSDLGHYSHFSIPAQFSEISFTTFITSHPDYHADGC